MFYTIQESHDVKACLVLTRLEGRVSVGNGFWRILKATERSFLYLHRKIWGTICISVLSSKFWRGTCPPVPRDLRPCTEVMQLLHAVNGADD